MFQMVLLIIHKLDECTSVLDAWEEIGVGGITILESTGLGRARKASVRSDLPLMPTLADFFRRPEHRHRTIFTVVDSDEKVDQLIAVTQKVLGNLEEPNNGVIFVLPVSRAVGVKGGQARANNKQST